MSGIDRTSGHVGMSSASQLRNTASQVGGAAFEMARTGVTIGAGIAGGPAAANAANSVMSMARAGVSGASSGGGGLGGLDGQVSNQTNKIEQAGAAITGETDDRQIAMLKLQSAINMQSSSFNTLTNCQKAKHDAAMAAIQNTR